MVGREKQSSIIKSVANATRQAQSPPWTIWVQASEGTTGGVCQGKANSFLPHYGPVNPEKSEECLQEKDRRKEGIRSTVLCLWQMDVGLQASEGAAQLMADAKGQYGNGLGEERSLLITPIVALREYAEALEAGGQPQPKKVYQRPDGQYVVEVLPKGYPHIPIAIALAFVHPFYHSIYHVCGQGDNSSIWPLMSVLFVPCKSFPLLKGV